MVGLGFLFVIFLAAFLLLGVQNKLENRKWLLWVAILMVPLPYIASESGWILAEVGRQPWVIQNILPTMAAVSKISTGSVQVTFWMFVLVFTGLLIAELMIMFKQIKLGPKKGGH
jgi:cytochrome d ubiquinol oxidase subunit I